MLFIKVVFGVLLYKFLRVFFYFLDLEIKEMVILIIYYI